MLQALTSLSLPSPSSLSVALSLSVSLSLSTATVGGLILTAGTVIFFNIALALLFVLGHVCAKDRAGGSGFD